ncbi:MAG: invasion associated locus B family protein [Alphaproteobacteria bacterium]|nr:invasion associated locus B family protein [Alphaproteobacteria bacterium]MBV9692425.1 invasion associated locus B family protein [Alphaproteobacteria bacterium]
MRNTVLGGILAAVLVGGLFLASQTFKKPAVGAMDASGDPNQIAKALRDDFIGQQKIGDWLLVCGPVHELPKAPGSGSGNSAGTAPKEAPPPEHWHIPRCRVVYSIHSASGPSQEKVRITFREFGFKRVLALFLRFPPDDVTTGDAVALDLDKTEWQVPIRTCARVACLSIQSIKFADVPVVTGAKSMTLKYTPSGTQEKVTMPVPTTGLAAALGAMRRIDT